MEDSGAGGLVKKLLFPASNAGSNDTFRTPNNGTFTKPVIMSPRSQNPYLQSRSPHYLPADAAKTAPLGFFHSTKPNGTKLGGSRNRQNVMEQLEVPSSPPSLMRVPVTPTRNSSAIAVPGERIGLPTFSSTGRSDDRRVFLRPRSLGEDRRLVLADDEQSGHDTELSFLVNQNNENNESKDISPVRLDTVISPTDRDFSDLRQEPTEVELPTKKQLTVHEKTESDGDQPIGDFQKERVQQHATPKSILDNPLENPLAKMRNGPSFYMNNTPSDINSTGSERGTIIENGDRLAELQSMMNGEAERNGPLQNDKDREGKLQSANDMRGSKSAPTNNDDESVLTADRLEAHLKASMSKDELHVTANSPHLTTAPNSKRQSEVTDETESQNEKSARDVALDTEIQESSTSSKTENDTVESEVAMESVALDDETYQRDVENRSLDTMQLESTNPHIAPRPGSQVTRNGNASRMHADPSIIKDSSGRSSEAVDVEGIDVKHRTSRPQTTRLEYLDRLPSNMDEIFNSPPPGNFTTPSSFLLRSPGSTARLMADVRSTTGTAGTESNEKYTVFPRVLKSASFSSSVRSGSATPKASRNTRTDHVMVQPPKGKWSIKSGMDFARGCLSYDTSMDDYYDTPLDVTNWKAVPIRRQTAMQPRNTELTEDSEGRNWGPIGAKLMHSLSASHLDDSEGLVSRTRGNYPKAFRSNPHSGNTKGLYSFQEYERIENGHPTGHEQLIHRLPGDFESISSQGKGTMLDGKSTTRGEIGHEALDILACLVKQGTAVNSGGNLPAQTRNDSPNEDEKQNGSKVDETLPQSMISNQTIDVAVSALREMSVVYESLDESKDGMDATHQNRMSALNELVSSYEYAQEMKNLASKASKWLAAIENSHSETNVNESTKLMQEESSSDTHHGTEQENTIPIPERVDVLSLKAMLRNAQAEAQEKASMARKLDEELSKCRAEIGRLKSASRAENLSFKSANNSMLDQEEDSTTESPTRVQRKDSDFGEGVDLESSLFRDDIAGSSVNRESSEQDLLYYKSALSDANSIIQKLHAELAELKQEKESCAPVVSVGEKAGELKSKGKSSDNTLSDHQTINVRMLDGENFVTEWDELTPPLPPPPDHGLRSPICMAVLQQWTDQKSLHDSLLAWMDRIISGGNPLEVPPLTLSSLDHQVRDGFVMHVLPLLLRRSDIHVDVKMRAHRHTKYDLAVALKALGQDFNSNAENIGSIGSGIAASASDAGLSTVGSVTHSTVTTHTRNTTRPISSFQTSGVTEHCEVGSTAASYVPDEFYSTGDGNQPGIMSALGGAIGGLLTRRKLHNDTFASPPRGNRSYDFGSDMKSPGRSPALRQTRSATRATLHPSFVGEEIEEEPYHRVVSAPPGRIGVTFVDFRGHAMVSDVAQDSPLLGWIFPSDILIALDEVCVSGLRLRDIIKLLTSRKERQRAMRVISSQAMNEFTLNTSTVHDTP